MGLGTRVEVWYGTIPMYVDTLVGDQLCKLTQKPFQLNSSRSRTSRSDKATPTTTMARTAWWKKWQSEYGHGGGDAATTPPATPPNTRICAEDVIKPEENVSNKRNVDTSPNACQQRILCKSSELGDVKGNEEQISSRNDGEERDETKETMAGQEHEERSEHSEEQLSCCSNDVILATEEDFSNDDDVRPNNKKEVEDNVETIEFDSLSDEAPNIERADSKDSTVGSAVDSHASSAVEHDNSEHATVAMTVNSSNTESTDDGILRDDEGNPVDLSEVEDNMLRDEEGNIIDPKTLVMREPFLDLCCERDEYCDNLTDAEIDHDTYVRVTLEAIVSEMITFIEEEACNKEDSRDTSNEGCNEECTKEIDEANTERDQEQEPRSESDDNLEPLPGFGHGTRTSRSYYAAGKSRRRIRRGKAFARQANDDTVHIMFNNILSTLVEEEASGSIGEDSADKSDDEKSNISHKSTRSEKFIKARWSYCMQVMKSEASTAPLLDARDEIDDMIRPKEQIPDDLSVCSDEGTI